MGVFLKHKTKLVRHVTFNILTLTILEYLNFQKKSSISTSFRKYLNFFPGRTLTLLTVLIAFDVGRRPSLYGFESKFFKFFVVFFRLFVRWILEDNRKEPGIEIGLGFCPPWSNVRACARNCVGSHRSIRKTLHVAVTTAAPSCELEAKFCFYFNEGHRR